MRMSPALPLLVVFVAGTSLAAADRSSEKEERVARAQLPAAVQATADRESAGATVKGFAKVVDKGQVVYEMELSVGGLAKDVLIGADGNVFEIEEEVPFSSLPPEIQAGLKQQAGKGKIGKVTAISKNTAITGYEADVVTNGKKSEIEVGVDGKPPAPPAKPEQVP